MKDREYWQHNFEQMGYYDLPAFIDYILEHNSNSSLTYIGHSQGTAQLFAALTFPERLEYFQSRINLFLAFGPVSKLGNSRSTLLTFMSKYTGFLVPIAEKLKIYELLPWHYL